MMSAHTHISNSYFTLRSSAYFDFFLLWKIHDMYCLAWTISNALNNHILLCIFLNVKSKKTCRSASFWMWNYILVKLFANLAFKSSPNIRINNRSFFFMLFTLKPFPNAFQVDRSNRASTITRRYYWIAWFFFRKTNSTLWLFRFICTRKRTSFF